MDYNLIITEAAEHQLEQIIFYLLYELENSSAATHLLNQIERLYIHLKENPFQFPLLEHPYFPTKKYCKAVILTTNYLIIYRIENKCVYIIGFFHQSENYFLKLSDA